ncbi:translation initiation factor IF-2 [Streptomyces sp. NPDC054834]
MRAKKWPENTRTEWPDAELGAQGLPVTGNDIQSFPETGTTDVLPGGAVPDAGPTEMLPAVRVTGTAGPSAHDPHAHDPLEVTVQLDADRIADERTRLAEHGRAPRGGGQDPSGGPVFVDASGRRRRTFRRLGMFAGTACAVYAVVIVATLLSGSSDAPWLPVPGQNEDKPAGQVDISPAPADSARPSGRTGAAPATGPRVPGGAAPSPGGSAAAPGATGTARQPGASADPQPTATNPTSGAGSAGGSSPDPEPTAPTPSTTPPTPTGPAGGSVSPSPSTGGDGGTGIGTGPGGGTGTGTGTGTVADGPVGPAPAAASPTSV